MGSFARAAALAAALCLVGADAGGDAAERIEVTWESAAGEITAAGALAVYRPSVPDERPESTPSRFRARVLRFAAGRPAVRASVASIDPSTSRVRGRLEDLPLERTDDGGWVTPWLVIVADTEDRDAPWLSGRALVARLGDLVELRVRRGAGRATTSTRTVGASSAGAGPLSILRLPLRAIVLRTAPGGPPVVGGDDRGAEAIMADQLAVADAVLAQCHVSLDASSPAGIAVRDPPGTCLIHVGGPYGLDAAGGDVRLAVDGRRLGPWRIGRGNTPEETARRIAGALHDAGIAARISVNPRTGREASPTADLVVRRPDGEPATVSPWPDPSSPLTTDRQQPLALGAVDLADGLESYAAGELGLGTLEERTLIRALGDPNSTAVSVFVVDRFSDASKQGESFLAGSSVGPAILLDWRGVARARQAYALAHEVVHLLLGDLRHPDDGGDGRTWLLMHSRSASARFGPKRITAESCAAIRENAAGLLAPRD
jgi:hypothetical protein